MAKRKSGGHKLKQEGFKVPKKVKSHSKKHTSKAPWDDPLKQIMRGGSRH